MPAKLKISFKDLLAKFPKIDLPITLTEEMHHTFSAKNPPLSQDLIHQYLLAEGAEIDEFTEYIACFRIPKTDGFHALVYWKAELLTYEYVMVTFDKKGVKIEEKVIAGTKVENDLLVRSVATIEEDWIIYCVRGVAPADEKNYNPSTTQSLHLELLATGEIIFSK